MYSSLLQTILLFFIYLNNVNGFSIFGTGFRQLKNYLPQSGNYNISRVNEKWIEQPLDHFDSQETKTWKMKYFENLELWKPNGPVLLFIGGEAPADANFISQGMLIWDIAREINGALFESEHRYYGQSMPLPISDTESLKYLSSRQAIEDLVILLKAIKSNPNFSNSKIVVFGGSYPGNLAAWVRVLHPELVDAAVSSSAPVLAKKDFFEYIETVSEDYKYSGTGGCWKKISQIFSRYDSLFQSEEGIKQLKQEENICQSNDLTRPENKQTFFLIKLYDFQNNAQNGSPQSIQDHCATLGNSINSSRYVFEDRFTFWREELKCNSFDFEEFVKKFRGSSWIYQTCTEFGYFQTLTSRNQPFTNNLPPEYYYKLCMALYGPNFNENSIDKGIETTNRIYGGLNPNVQKVIFVNGDMDPWHRLGILKDLSNYAPAKVIPKASHCRDIYANRPDDSKELLETKLFVKSTIKNWLGMQ